MEVVIVDTPEMVGIVGADIVERVVRRHPSAVLGLATGSSPLSTYRELIRRHLADGLSFRTTTCFLLDEYVGLPPDHPCAYLGFIAREFTRHVDLPDNQLHAPDGAAENLVAACDNYERAIAAAGGVDAQLLGIGTNGHIGFNEPGSSLASRTRVKTLATRTRQDNARFFSSLDEVPRHVVTQGIGTILQARHLLLVASGGAKAEAVAAAVEGPVAAILPASALQLHPHATVVIDDAAASRLRNGDYYRQTFADKPAWQTL